jgi:hypothetical protein
MANIREIKNEINYLTLEVIDDCNTFIAYNSDKKEEAVKLIEEAVGLRNRLIEKVNNPDNLKNKYFNDLRKQLEDGADAIFEKLRKLIN